MKEALEVKKPIFSRRLCRTLSIGCTGIARCLVEPAPHCDFAVASGSVVFCTHADRHLFEKHLPAKTV
ncbi:MAG TPA: hypothetical protein VL171_09075 [Verrucomicrobiae bacterium]|nr:hypothetical protein [Verrucomicrobiae bacterium]